MTATTEIPNDLALPVLAAIRACGLAVVLPALELEGCPVELTLRGYSEGSRVALEARAGQRHFAVKAYEDDPSPEVELYGVLAANGFTDSAPVRVPPLLGWNRDLHVLAIGWLDGPTAHELIECGQGRRAGELAARWVQRAATLPVKLGRPFGAPRMLHRGRKWAAALGEADPALGGAATALVEMLARTQPKQEAEHLLHGTLYARHVLDLGNGTGLIDWDRFAQGPLELDAGMFLASIGRLGLLHESLAGEAARAEEAFLSGIARVVNERALAWHRAAALLRLTEKYVFHRRAHWPALAQTLLAKAARLAETAGSIDYGPPGARNSSTSGENCEELLVAK